MTTYTDDQLARLVLRCHALERQIIGRAPFIRTIRRRAQAILRGRYAR